MKNRLNLLIQSISILASCLIIGSASAQHGHGGHGGHRGGHSGWHSGGHGGHGWHGGGHGGHRFHGGGFGFYYGAPYYYYPRYYYPSCWWVRGHYNYYGVWIPPHKRCY